MLKLTIDKINNYAIEGYIYCENLTNKQMDCLKLKRDPEFCTEVRFVADFVVEWDDDIPMIQIETLCLVGAPTGKTFWGPTGKNATYCEILPNDHPRQGMLICKGVWGDIPVYNTLDLDENQYNIDELCDEVSQSDTGEWAADKQSSLADHYYDSYRDEQMGI